ncbi:MAG: filamentous hemagglutinin N-terminal domain-containing protein [Leptolyngbya sp. SIO4C1]|nr:filamentous hemagglutinin N-terminal domain-containing protein [Leptolyngbya sp. SIO4C1]
MRADREIANRLTVGLAILGSLLGKGAIAPSAIAQIIPDNTLPTPSRVTVGCTLCTIEGGTRQGNNLFHSFTEFSVPTGGEAIFNTLNSVDYIFSRVTGSAVSNIDGLLQANGTADLFLLNPNGILFGPNAQLDLGGAFVVSTADAIQFADQRFYSANAAETSLLTVSTPVGLAHWTQPVGTITSTGNLAVETAQSLVFAGGDISLAGGNLTALGGRVELGGLADIGTIGLAIDGATVRLTMPEMVNRSHVSLVNDARVDVTADGGGDITIQAQDVSLVGERTGLLAGIDFFSGTSDSQAGDITINATGTVKIDQADLLNEVLREAAGSGGNITVVGRELFLLNGGQINATSFSAGSTGQITVEMREGILISGVGVTGRRFLTSSLNSTVRQGGQGESGGIEISVSKGSLRIANGGAVSATVAGTGTAGDIDVQVRDAVVVDGVHPVGFPSALGSIIQVGATGQGGNLDVAAGTVSILNGADIAVSTFGIGDAGNITIAAREAILLRGPDVFVRDFPGNAERVGGISAGVQRSTLFPGAPPAEGNGGDINLITPSLSILDGAMIEVSTASLGNAGNINIAARNLLVQGRSVGDTFSSGIFSNVLAGAVGEGGRISVAADFAQMTEEGAISTASFSQGDAGDIQLRANVLRLDENALISAETRSSAGGDVRLELGQALLLRNGGRISTTAGTAQAGGDGGNIVILVSDGFVVAMPQENSDITANAFAGRGGSIALTARGILGIAPRSEQTALSDITASSALGVSGTIEVNTLDLDPDQGLIDLPAEVLDASQQVAQGCDPAAVAGGAQGEFYNSGRGGIVPLADNALSSDQVLEDLRLPEAWSEGPLVEAQGWLVSEANQVVLTVAPHPATVHHPCRD